jgi:uncharacterized small protein (DUF1192 family)
MERVMRRAKDMAEAHRRMSLMQARIERLEASMNKFVDRCESGEVLSTKTQREFRRLLGREL